MSIERMIEDLKNDFPSWRFTLKGYLHSREGHDQDYASHSLFVCHMDYGIMSFGGDSAEQAIKNASNHMRAHYKGSER